MSWYYRLSIKAKLYLSFLIVITLTLIISILALVSMDRNQSVAEYASYNIQASVIKVDKAISRTTASQTDILEFINRYKNNKQSLNDAENLLKELNLSINELDATRFGKAVDNCKVYYQEILQIYNSKIKPQVLAGDKRADITAYHLDNLSPVYDKLLGNLRDIRTQELHDLLQQTDKLSDNSSSILIAICTLTVLIVSFIIASLTGNYCKKAIDNIIKDISLLESQDYSQKFSARYHDEFGKLINSLENLRLQQQAIIAHIKKAVGEVIENMHNVSNDMQALANTASQTESRTITVAASTDEMVSTTREIAHNCESASELANKSNSMTNQGIAQAKQSITSIYRQSEQTKKDSAQINAMISQSRNISTIVSTIDEIAGQTNLLALNAAIEAARAGDAGRGFAVVADEVRALAMRTTNSTNEITQMVDLIEKDAEVATVSLERSVNDIDAIAHDTSNLEHVLNDILNNVNEVNSQITQITVAVDQQTTSSSEISSHIQEITHSMKDVTRIARETTDLVNSTVESTNRLNQEVMRFKV